MTTFTVREREVILEALRIATEDGSLHFAVGRNWGDRVVTAELEEIKRKLKEYT